MEHAKQSDWLDKAILRTVPGAPAQSDFARWRNKHTHALDTLKLRAQQRTRSQDALASTITFGRRIMESKYTKIAVAAAIIIGLFCLAQYLTGNQVIPEQPAPKAIADQNQTERPKSPLIAEQETTQLEQELELAQTLFARGDVAGLIALLNTGQEKTKLAIAGYLGEIGDESAVPVLQKLADAWQGPPGDNLFRQAMDVIESRRPKKSPDQKDPNQQVREPSQNKRPWEFQPQGVLSGTLTDALTGEPIVGAEVEIWWHQARAYTNEHGFYSFSEIKHNGNWQVRVHSKAYLVGGWHAVPLKQTEQAIKHFQFRKGCQVKVKVTNEQDEPLEDVWVFDAWLGAEDLDIEGTRDETGPGGYVTVGAMEPSDIEYRLIASHPDYASSHVTMNLTDPDTIENAHIVLKPGVDVHGYAAYADGAPAEGLRISARPNWAFGARDYPVDAQGNFTLQHIVPGIYDLYVSIPDDNSSGAFLSMAVGQKQLPVPPGELLTVQVPRKSPQSLASISGRILWASEKRPQSFRVSVTNRATNTYQTILVHEKESMDAFLLSSLEPGTYTLEFEGVNLRRKTVANVQAPCHDVEVALEYADKPRLAGEVIYADTQTSVAEFKARVLKLKTLRGPNYVPEEKWQQCSDGFFDIEIPGSGVYQVQITAEGYASALSPAINTDENPFVKVEITKGGALKGRVVTRDGAPVSNATVIPLSCARGHMPRTLNTFVSEQGAVKSSQNGAFLVAQLPPGRETLKVTHPDYSFAVVKNIEILAGQMTEDVEICLNQGGSVDGTVFNTQGRPEANVTLLFQDAVGYGGSGDEEAGRLAVAVADANGYYAVSGLPINKVCYVRRKNWNSLGTSRRSFIPLEGRVTQLDLGGPRTVSGTIVLDGSPLADTKVILVYPGQSNFSSFHNTAMTNAQGEFCFQGIPKGRYAVYYRKTGRRSQWVCATSSVPCHDNVDLGIIQQRLANIEVILTGEGLKQGPWTVYLQEGAAGFWKARMGEVRALSADKTSYVIEQVLPGTHRVVASRKGMKIRKSVEVKSSGAPHKVTLQIPSGSGSISGVFSSPVQQSLLLWNAEKTITVHISPPGEPFLVERLPAGRYMIGNYFFAELAPLVEFTLAEGEHRIIDLDTGNWSTEIGNLIVRVISDTGIILSHAETWLEGPTGRVGPSSNDGHAIGFYVPPGDYVLVSQCPGYQSYSKSITIEPYKLHTTESKYQTQIIQLKAQ